MRFSLALFLLCGTLFADPLPSWNEGPTKRAILSFVSETTQGGGKNFLDPKDRIAVLDEDGTLWIEQPLYVRFFFAYDRIRQLAPNHPEWQSEEPFRSIIDGNIDVLKSYNEKDISKIIAATHAGMTVEEFQAEVNKWLATAVHPKLNRPFTELVYQPMLEVIHFLKTHQFHVYIVSSGGQDFMRAYAEGVYKIPVENIVGTAGKVKYDYNDGHPKLVKEADLLFDDNFAGKVEGIHLMIGKRPIIAFGNSTGDQQMLEWAQGGPGRSLELLVHHDDAKREYAYGPDSKIGTFSDALMDEATKQNWMVISMKNDWNVIFPPEKPKSDTE